MSQVSHKRSKAGSIPASATKLLEAPTAPPRMMISEYTYGDEPDPTKSIIQIRIKYRGGSWAVYDSTMKNSFNVDGNWEIEPLPSARSDAYLERNRYELIDALAAAKRAYQEIRENDRRSRIEELSSEGDSSGSSDDSDGSLDD